MAAMGQTIHFFAQDEGSAKAVWPLFSLCASWPGVKARFFVAKYALDFLERRGVECTRFTGMGRTAQGDELPDLIVTGASMRSSIEKEAIAWARLRGVMSLTVVDHGSDFWGRFTPTGEPDLSALPDRILVPDMKCREEMRAAGFPPARLAVTGNPSFDEYKPLSQALPVKRTILCVMQPEFLKGEYRSDSAWFSIIQQLASEFATRARLIVRPHPKEDPRAYQSLEAAGIVLDPRSDITGLIAQSDVVIGRDSTSLIEAVFRGKVVISLDCGGVPFVPLPTERMGLSARAFSRDELRLMIEKAFLQPRQPKRLKRIRYYNDGKNTARAAKCLRSLLKGALSGRVANG